jgi:uncharacterized membrane protein YkoI
MNGIMKKGTGVVVVVIVALTFSTGCALFGPKKESDQVISMQDLPAAVKPLAQKETSGCNIIEVEKEYKHGKVIYAITYDQTGTKMELEYAEDGTLISKGKE